MSERYGDAWVCQDCYVAHHYGSYAMMLSDDGDLDGPLDPGELDYLRANSPQRIIWFANEDDEPVGGWYEIRHNHSLEHNREPLWALRGFEVFDNICSNHEWDREMECSVCDDGYIVPPTFDGDWRILDDGVLCWVCRGFGKIVRPCSECGSDEDEDGIREFSWRACDGCHSPLGGSRHRLSLWKREEVTNGSAP